MHMLSHPSQPNTITHILLKIFTKASFYLNADTLTHRQRQTYREGTQRTHLWVYFHVYRWQIKSYGCRYVWIAGYAVWLGRSAKIRFCWLKPCNTATFTQGTRWRTADTCVHWYVRVCTYSQSHTTIDNHICTNLLWLSVKYLTKYRLATVFIVP